MSKGLNKSVAVVENLRIAPKHLNRPTGWRAFHMCLDCCIALGMGRRPIIGKWRFTVDKTSLITIAKWSVEG